MSTSNTRAAQVCPRSAMQIQRVNHTVVNNVYICLTVFFILLQVKNEPYPPGEEYAFVLENGAIANAIMESKKIYFYLN